MFCISFHHSTQNTTELMNYNFNFHILFCTLRFCVLVSKLFCHFPNSSRHSKLNTSFYTLVNSARSHLSSDRADVLSARQAQMCSLLIDKQEV